MSPSRKLGGSPRLAPLKVSKDSHLIHKSSSFSSSSSPSNSDVSNNNGSSSSNRQQHQQPQPQQRQPVIIYTHSPKIIHTQARDFMALVQKLTGMSRPEDDEGGPAQPPQGGTRSRPDGTAPPAVSARSDGTPLSPEDSDVHGGQLLLLPSVPPPPPPPPPPMFEPPPNQFLSDIPLFTPNPSDLFCSPRHYYSYPSAVFSPPNVGSSISPSLMEVMKAFHDY